jgi:hypothetical protein
MNSKRIRIAGVVLVLVGALALAAVVAAHPGGPGGWGRDGNGPMTAVAETLGIDEEALFTALQEGTTVAELAEEADVPLDTVVDAVIAQHEERVAAAIEAGRLTQEQADEMEAQMREALTERFSQPFEGRGFGREHGMGRGWGLNPDSTPRALPDAAPETGTAS